MYYRNKICFVPLAPLKSHFAHTSIFGNQKFTEKFFRDAHKTEYKTVGLKVPRRFHCASRESFAAHARDTNKFYNPNYNPTSMTNPYRFKTLIVIINPNITYCPNFLLWHVMHHYQEFLTILHLQLLCFKDILQNSVRIKILRPTFNIIF